MLQPPHGMRIPCVRAGPPSPPPPLAALAPPPPLPGGPARGRAGLGEAQGLPLAQMGKLEDFYEISPKFMKSVEFHEI